MSERIKALILDVDGTLSYPDQPISYEIANILMKCLDITNICILTSRRFEQVEERILNQLYGASEKELSRLHLCVAQGTECFGYDLDEKKWKVCYLYPLSETETTKITKTIEGIAKEFGFWKCEELEKDNDYFDCCNTQVTYSGLGVRGKRSGKKEWDPDYSKRKKIVEKAKKVAPEFDYKIGGSTSIDVTVSGMDKYFGITQVLKYLDLKESEIVYICDETESNGNDFPIVRSGDFFFHAVSDPTETLIYLKGFYDARK